MIPLIVTSFSNTGLEAYIAVIYTIQILLRATWLRFIVAARPNNDIFIVSILGVLRCQMGELRRSFASIQKADGFAVLFVLFLAILLSFLCISFLLLLLYLSAGHFLFEGTDTDIPIFPNVYT
jgi:hypothetical protein